MISLFFFYSHNYKLSAPMPKNLLNRLNNFSITRCFFSFLSKPAFLLVSRSSSILPNIDIFGRILFISEPLVLILPSLKALRKNFIVASLLRSSSLTKLSIASSRCSLTYFCHAATTSSDSFKLAIKSSIN